MQKYLVIPTVRTKKAGATALISFALTKDRAKKKKVGNSRKSVKEKCIRGFKNGHAPGSRGCEMIFMLLFSLHFYMCSLHF